MTLIRSFIACQTMFILPCTNAFSNTARSAIVIGRLAVTYDIIR